ncbi:CYFA0S02e03136g1_1 [Cyberlindnera fabianii]|uniref:Mitochondrial fission 1 protein n=1 Tax=Cyberlindnera fabianii TaxID=36022 RepID=A0A061ALW3_CYBFA|nr:CYFA0S02e03136g1_1 [Cyberlindnera fabianii]
MSEKSYLPGMLLPLQIVALRPLATTKDLITNITYTALEDANTPLSTQQLEILRQQVLSEGDLVSVQSRFNYAWGLIKSTRIDDQRLGIKLLTDVFRDSPQRRRECLYYLSVGTYKLGDYSDARRYADALIAHEPDNHQAKALKKMIEDKIAKDGLIGVALVSGAVAAAAATLSFVLRKKR